MVVLDTCHHSSTVPCVLAKYALFDVQRRKMLGIDNHVEARNGSDMDNSSADETSENKAVLLEEHAPVLPEELRVGYAKLAKYVPRPEEDEPQGIGCESCHVCRTHLALCMLPCVCACAAHHYQVMVCKSLYRCTLLQS